jgi:putative copper resistance protein D
LDDPLIWVRAIHFAATLSVAGVVFFLSFIGEPAFRAADKNESIAIVVRRRLAGIAWLGLAVVVVSDVAWLLLQSAQMSDRPLVATWSEDIVSTVLLDTDFGNVWLARSVLIAALVVALYASCLSAAPQSQWRRAAVLACAAALVGTLAFAGHAAAGSGVEGLVHETADVLHLLAAAAWVGALVPLAVLLGAAAKNCCELSLAVAREATLRFSTFGIASVAIVLATGIVNTWELAGSVPALFGTDYGRLLLTKVALFLVMVSVAGVNRLRLTPRLVGETDAAARRRALRQVRNNSLIEASLAAIILLIVGVLGTLPPGNEQTSRSPLYARFAAGTGTPGIFMRTEPSVVRLVKYNVLQSSPPNARLVVCGLPWTMRPSFLPLGSMT